MRIPGNLVNPRSLETANVITGFKNGEGGKEPEKLKNDQFEIYVY